MWIEAQASISYKWCLIRCLNEPGIYLNPDVYFLLLPVQGRMVDASTSIYEFDSVVRGQCIYETAWTSLADKMHKCILWEDSECDKLQ